MAKAKRKITFSKFEAADYLDSEEVMAEYLVAAMEDADPDVFLAALRNIAKARGMMQVAEDAGLNRESLYKALAPGAKPRFQTIQKVMDSLGLRLTTVSKV